MKSGLKNTFANKTVTDIKNIKGTLITARNNYLERRKTYLKLCKLLDSKEVGFEKLKRLISRKDQIDVYIDHLFDDLYDEYKQKSELLVSHFGSNDCYENEFLKSLRFDKINFDKFLFQFQSLVNINKTLDPKHDLLLFNKLDKLETDPTNHLADIDAMKMVQINYEMFEVIEQANENVKNYLKLIKNDIKNDTRFAKSLLAVFAECYLIDGKIQVNEDDIETILVKLDKLNKQKSKLHTKKITDHRKFHELTKQIHKLQHKKDFLQLLLLDRKSHKSKIVKRLEEVATLAAKEKKLLSEQKKNITLLTKELKILKEDYNFDKHLFD